MAGYDSSIYSKAPGFCWRNSRLHLRFGIFTIVWCFILFVFRRVYTTIFVLSWVQSHSSGSCHEAWLLSFRMFSVIHRGLRLRTNLVAWTLKAKRSCASCQFAYKTTCRSTCYVDGFRWHVCRKDWLTSVPLCLFALKWFSPFATEVAFRRVTVWPGEMMRIEIELGKKVLSWSASLHFFKIQAWFEGVFRGYLAFDSPVEWGAWRGGK